MRILFVSGRSSTLHAKYRERRVPDYVISQMAQPPGNLGMGPADDEHISPGLLSCLKKRILDWSAKDVNRCLAAGGSLKFLNAVPHFLLLIAVILRGGAGILKDMNQ
jgi:hypothetical protein